MLNVSVTNIHRKEEVYKAVGFSSRRAAMEDVSVFLFQVVPLHMHVKLTIEEYGLSLWYRKQTIHKSKTGSFPVITFIKVYEIILYDYAQNTG
jgi:hypothetical protein